MNLNNLWSLWVYEPLKELYKSYILLQKAWARDPFKLIQEGVEGADRIREQAERVYNPIKSLEPKHYGSVQKVSVS